MTPSINKLTTLPLSWTSSSSGSIVYSITLFKNTIWLNGGNLVESNDFIAATTRKNNKIVIRGVNDILAESLKIYNFHKFLFAQEAIIELNKDFSFHKNHLRRIKSLLKRGRIREIPFSERNLEKFKLFLKDTAHNKEPKLKNLFINEPNNRTRFFVFEFEKGIWEGGLLISQNSKTKMQGEQIFRKLSAKNGIIDTLIFEVSNILRSESFIEFSLGEVPFLIKEELPFFSRENLLSNIGKFLTFVYNSKNLYNFKNKFASRWDNIYLCSNKSISIFDVFMIGYKSNFLALVKFSLLKRIKNTSD